LTLEAIYGFDPMSPNLSPDAFVSSS